MSRTINKKNPRKQNTGSLLPSRIRMIAALLEYTYNIQYFRESVNKYYSNLKYGMPIDNYYARFIRLDIEGVIMPISFVVYLSVSSGTTVSKSMYAIAETEFGDIQPNQVTSFDTTFFIGKEHYLYIYPDKRVEVDTLIPKKFTLQQSKFYSTASPLSFRTFITYSTNEQFTTESYIDNSFYINTITEMPVEAFEGKKNTDSTNNNTQNIWASPNSFYVYKKINILK